MSKFGEFRVDFEKRCIHMTGSQMFETELFTYGYVIAAHQSVHQRRKYTGEPYDAHCRTVRDIVAHFDFITPVRQAALLHDVLEDTPITEEEMRSTFDKDVVDLVLEVTERSKKSDGNRKIRKEIDRLHFGSASYEGKSIKLADLIDNTLSIATKDPDFAIVYLKEKKALLEVLSDGHPDLYRAAQETLEKALKFLGKEIHA